MYRRVKDKERRKAGNIYCDYCKPEKVDAVFRKEGFANHDGDFACEKHLPELMERVRPTPRSEHLTEADHQTWMRL